jgi:hypothetical protein
MKLLTFSNYILESAEPNNSNIDTDQLKSTLTELNYLLSIGVISGRDAKSEITKLQKEIWQIKNIDVKKLDANSAEYIDDLIKLGDDTGLAALATLKSDGAKALIAKGVYMVSSITQLGNGSLIFSVDPNYRRSDGWGIGFFPGPKIIRRMTPKGINIGVWSRTYGSMDILIKKFNDTGSDLEFYNTALLWAAENIDFEHAKLYPENQVWKYYKKKKETRAKRSESDDLRVQADAIDSKLRIGPYQSDPDRLAALKNHLEAWKLRLKSFELDNKYTAASQSAIDNAKSRIRDIEQDIAMRT